MLSDSLVVHKTGTMKNYHNSFLCYFGWEELDPGMRTSAQCADRLMRPTNGVDGSDLIIARGDVALVNGVLGLLPISFPKLFC